MAPWSERLHNRLGAALWTLGRREEALKEFAEAVRLNPRYAEAHYRLGTALWGTGRQKEAAVHLAEALRLEPNNAEILNGVAWLLATHPQAGARNGVEAVHLAKRACQLSGGRRPASLGTLDAAYAEAGRFEEAIRTGERARDLALAAGERELAKATEYRLSLYRNGQPFRQK